jgi:hypothetical protein
VTYTPYLDDRDLRKHLTSITADLIDKLEMAIVPLTKEIRKGIKALQNRWDARDPIKV